VLWGEGDGPEVDQVLRYLLYQGMVQRVAGFTTNPTARQPDTDCSIDYG
jgi:hypothetical protein